MFDIARLDDLDVTKKTVPLKLGGLELEVRGLSALEMAEIGALFPEPEPPAKKNADGKEAPDYDDPGYVSGCVAQTRRHNAVAAAVAAGFTAGGLEWTREKLLIEPWPLAARIGEGPHKQRMDYAAAVAEPMLANLGGDGITRILEASHRAAEREGKGPAAGSSAGKDASPAS